MTETVSIQEPVITDTSTPVQATEQAPVLSTPTTEPVKPSSLLDQVSPEVKAEEAYWKDDWRQKVAGEDPKMLKELEKHKTPAELAKAYRELQKQFSSTRPAPELAKDATPEQVSEWREKVGIPETWDKYDTALDNGVIIGENDKAIVEKYLQKAHDANMKPDEVKKSLQTYFEMMNADEAQRIRNAEISQTNLIQDLQNQWGVQYKGNISLVKTHLEQSLGEEAFTKLNQATLPDGTFVINNPIILNHLLKQAKQEMGSHTITDTPSTDLTSLTDRKKQIEKIALTDSKLYYNSPELRKELNEIDTIISNKR